MKYATKTILFLVMFVTALVNNSCEPAVEGDMPERIKIYSENPFYWEFNGAPVLLLGGSREDNLFNHPDGLSRHLDTLRMAGGNYIRNTMSSRNPGNPWPHKRLETGLYDLDQWDKEYWQRFGRTLLTMTRCIMTR